MKFLSIFAGIQRIKFYMGLLLVGILFTVLAGMILFGNTEQAVEVEGTIIERYDRYETGEDTTTEYARVRYIADGKEYVGEVPCSSFDKVGETMKIAYNPSNPAEPFSAGTEWMPYLFFGIGIVSILASLFLSARAIIRKLR